ncbi:hypothetical protein MRB53_001963 [Persea americana]|uniref:Uncharacterized protein n=1 Tax=Persea americana TaxID=3435 RepID=A0ACC2MT75_PERAE|nr:hypothetical protein MRB53_001963 [Persea americana]
MMMQNGYDINKLFQEAQSRWLKSAEVFFVLQNYDKHHLNLKPPENPQSGSLFLFNRRVLRFFRKDGVSWRKKKDGKTVGEAHERLKVGDVDALNCYYAHGEQNPNFQRRCYWILDPTCDHIVLVHYREITDGKTYNGSTSNSLPDSFSIFSQSSGYFNVHPGSSGISELHESYQSSFSPGSVEEVSSTFVGRNNNMDHVDVDRPGEVGSSSYPEVNQALRRLTVQLSLDDDDGLMYLEKLPPDYSQIENPQDSELLVYGIEESKHDALIGLPLWEHDQWSVGNNGVQANLKKLLLQNSGDTEKQHGQPFDPGCKTDRKETNSWKEMLEMSSISTGINSQNKPLDILPQNGISHSPRNDIFKYEAGYHSKDATSLETGSLFLSDRGNVSTDLATQPEKLQYQWQDFKGMNETNQSNCHRNSESDFSLQLSATRQFLLGSDDAITSPSSSELTQKDEKSVHSRHSSATPTLGTDSGMGMLGRTDSTAWMETGNKPLVKHTPDCYEVWFNQKNCIATPVEADSSLTIPREQLFSIREISPGWAYSTESTKVIITGDFLCDHLEHVWGCMFGDIEVPAEVIQAGVLRCQAPQHKAGKVTFCITSDNKEPCSEVREFEYRMKLKSSTLDNNLPEKDAHKSTEELLLLAKFAKKLLVGHDSSSVARVDYVESGVGNLRNSRIADDPWDQIIESLLIGSENPSTIMDSILQELLKDKLQQWLSSRCRGGEVTDNSLSKEERSIIHTIAGLGYDWALNSILNVGVGINFRDLNGWTALHWAARFGREKMVAALLAAGASAGAVTDPTSQDPVGKSPASIAAACGHKGLAGYLSEVALTSHLSSLTMKESKISEGSAAVEAERTVESISDKSIQIPADAIEDQLSLKDSLAAVRNAAQAAARIQSAFHAYSFRRRQQRAAASCDEHGMTADDIHGLSAASKFLGLRDHKLNTAALSIQKKYRGWKGRKEFLELRQNVVKIQAHVRGHQVRRKYKFLWTVGVLEKVVLRWRRKGVGLRGFRAEPLPIDQSEDDDILKVFRKQKVDVAVDEAVSRVLSIVESPKARQQYRRILEGYKQAKAQISSNNGKALSSQGNDMESDVDDMHYFA